MRKEIALKKNFICLIKCVMCVLLVMPFLTGCNYTGADMTYEIKPGYYDAEYEGLTDKGASFLVCGTGGRMDRIFEDGTVENIPLPVGNRSLTSVLIGEDITLVSGISGALAYSRDGKKFESSNGADKEHILGLAQFKGKYYACTYSGIILSSDDGVSWKTDKSLTNKPLIAIASDGLYIMAITNDTDIFISKDGVKWELQNYNNVYDGLATRLSFINMVNLDEDFVIIGHEADNPGVPTVMYSSNGGESWMFNSLLEINSRSPEDFYPLTINSVCLFAGEMFGVCDKGRVLTFTDCPTCNLISDASSVNLRCMAINDNTMVVAGDDFVFEILNAAKLRQNKISAEQAMIEMGYGAVMIDVRTDEEYNTGHIPNSLHIPVNEVEAKLPAMIPDKNSLLIFYCAAGARAQTALETAQQLGYQNVFNLGGLSDWPYDIE